MNAPADLVEQIMDYRRHFDSIYVAGIPNLLNDDGAFLSFLTVLTGTEALAGLFAPGKGNGERFKEFVARYYPAALRGQAEKLWELRNAIVHAFHPGPYVLTHHASWAHLELQNGMVVLNAQDFYAALLGASHAYFAELLVSPDLQASFVKRISDSSGGAPQAWVAYAGRGVPNMSSN